MAAFSRHAAALDWAAQKAIQVWGSCGLASERFSFAETDYYAATMGGPLWKAFWAFAEPVDPAGLPDWKTATNTWEKEYAAAAGHDERRPLNIDPGYLTAAKLVLASTKDHAHRIYLRDGIYAEITLYYRDRAWQPCEWTYPDYRRADFQAFFSQCRDFLRGQRRVDQPPC